MKRRHISEGARELQYYLPYLISAGALLLAIANTWYSRKRDTQGDLQERFKELSTKLENVSNRLIVVETQTTIFFKGVSFSSAQALHSPHTPELDTLLEKFQRDQIASEEELERLETLVKKVARSDPNPLRRKVAFDILTLIEVRYKIGDELMSALSRQDESVHDTLTAFSQRLKG